MEADGDTALYDAVERAIEITDAATGDEGATRAVVVLSDGAATAGRCLARHRRRWTPTSEDDRSYCGMCDDDGVAQRARRRPSGEEVPVDEVSGDRAPHRPHDHDVQVFFLGFGDADINVGRILAEATDAEYQGSTEEDLAAVIEALSGYF